MDQKAVWLAALSEYHEIFFKVYIQWVGSAGLSAPSNFERKKVRELAGLIYVIQGYRVYTVKSTMLDM